jgi:hypothetical protein
LPTSKVVNVTADFTAIGAQAPNTSSLLILTDEPIIDVNSRIRTYSSLAGVAGDFGSTSSYAYQAAALWFGYSPQPQTIMVGRWASASTAAMLQGGVLTPAQQVLTNFTTITSGGLDLTINGTATNLTALNFDAQTNLNGVASVITTALAGAATCTWNGQNFTITTTATGAGAAASGTYTFASNPAANDTVSINGVTITFVATGATGNQVNLGSNATATIANLLGFLLNSSNTSLEALTYSVTGNVLTITDRTVGTAGNGIATAKSSTAITVSGATLTGGINAATISFATTGAGEDISTLLALTSTTANPVINGVNAESALNAVIACDDVATYWFALSVVTPTAQDSDKMAIAGYIETTDHIQGCSTQETTALSSTATSDIGYMLQQAGYERSLAAYNGSTHHAAIGFLAIVCTVDYTQPNSVVTAALKPFTNGIVADTLTTQQALALDTKRYNYYVNFNNGTAITQNGMMASNAFIDDIVGLQSLMNQIQTDEFNALIQLPLVPQTDAGMHQLTGLNNTTLAQYVRNGFIAPGTWTGEGFGALNYGDFLPLGYYVYREPIALQPIPNRNARQAVPATIAVKRAGAVHTDNILILVNR